jgi:hypothetical protein
MTSFPPLRGQLAYQSDSHFEDVATGAPDGVRRWISGRASYKILNDISEFVQNFVSKYVPASLSGELAPTPRKMQEVARPSTYGSMTILPQRMAERLP